MKQAGSLFDELGLQDIQSLKHLKITGDINGTDIMTINRMTSLKYLDLSDANIVEGGVTYRENLKTENDVVGSDFFYNIALETVLLPESAKKIDYSAFQNSPELKNVVIGKSVSSIGNYAFNNCILLNRINIPANVTSINQNVFSNCRSLEYLFFEDSPNTLSIGSTFSGIKLKSIYWGRNISSNTPFDGNKYLHTLTFGKDVTTLEASSFYGCSGLTSVALPEKLTEIPYSLFENSTSLQGVVIPNSITVIEDYAFRNTALEEVNLPATVTSIGDYSFGNTPTITNVVSLNTIPPEIKSSTFDSEVEEKAMLHVPKGSLVHYWLDPVWKDFGNMSDDTLCLDVIPEVDNNDEIEVYDMKGIRLYKGPRSQARLAKGFYLVRQGNNVAKVYVE